MWIVRTLLVSIMLAAETVRTKPHTEDSAAADVSSASVTPIPTTVVNSGKSSEEATTVTFIGTTTEASKSTMSELENSFTTTTMRVPFPDTITTSLEVATPTPAVLPTTTVEQTHAKNVAVEELGETTKTTTTTKKPAPLVLTENSTLPSHHDVLVTKAPKCGGRVTPKAPPPTPSTPGAGTSGIGELLKIPGIILPTLDIPSAVIDAVEKLG